MVPGIFPLYARACQESHDADLAERYQLPVPFSNLKFDLGLMPA